MGKTTSSRVTSRVLSLQQGESLDLEMNRGDSVSVLCGTVRLAGPARWMGESLVQTAVEIREGEQHLSTERGELALQALSACELCVLRTERPSSLRELREFCGRLVFQGGARRI
ncbi:hypothetical protein [Niveibacterium sp. SC-1]|uniref:hypothetical protein n=1 Tax=Niveibacterium sp. SC-1 TaxID=3135646 RepID=UPI00311DECDD